MIRNFVIGLTLLVLLTACEEPIDSASPSPTAHDGSSSSSVSPRPTVGAVSAKPADKTKLTGLAMVLTDTRRNGILDDSAVSQAVKEIVEDDRITFAEYEASVLAMADCVRDSGGVFLRPDQPRLSWRGLYTYTVGFRESVPGAQAQVSGCVEEHVGYLDLFWKEFVSPSETEIQSAMDDLAACMKSVGLERVIPAGRTRQEFEELGPILQGEEQTLYFGCAGRIGDKHALPYFGPTY